MAGALFPPDARTRRLLAQTWHSTRIDTTSKFFRCYLSDLSASIFELQCRIAVSPMMARVCAIVT